MLLGLTNFGLEQDRGRVEEHRGIHIGDVLVSINGEPFALESFENVCEALRLVLISDRLLRFRPAQKHYAAVSAQRAAVTVAGEGASLTRIRDQLSRIREDSSL